MLQTGKIIQIVDINGFRRLKFETDGTNYADYTPGMYIKIQYSVEGEDKFRSITISQNNGNNLAVDFVAHSKTGPAANWQRGAKIGDKFRFKGPGAASKCDYAANEFFFHADASSLPAMAAHLKKLEKGKKVNIYYDGESSIIHDYLELDFCNFYSDLVQFKNKLREHSLDKTTIWLAGEKGSISLLRDLMKDKIDKALSVYISSYWKKDATDEEHRLEKKAERAKNQ